MNLESAPFFFSASGRSYSLLIGAEKEGNKIMMINAFEKTFGNGMWNRLSFPASNARPIARYVAWIDIMGAKNFMWRSMPTCALFVGKLYDAVLKANTKKCCFYFVSDGVYICDTEFENVRDLVVTVVRSCAYEFISASNNLHRFLVRAAIAYGNTMTGSDFRGIDAKIKEGLIIGAPVAWANEAEKCAPPFGIYLHESCRGLQPNPDRPIGWILNNWWGKDDLLFAKDFGKKIVEYLFWEDAHRIETGLQHDKVSAYIDAVQEYFGLERNNGDQI